MNQNKQIVAALLAVAVITTAYFALQASRRGPAQQQGPQDRVVTELYGEIIEVKNSSVVIEGSVNRQFKRIEFALTPETVYKHTVNVISEEQIKQGGQFKAEQIVREGKKADLKPNMTVLSITTNVDLNQTDKATALEVNYQSYELPKLQ